VPPHPPLCLCGESSPLLSNNIILCGFKSAGKTTLGRKMAQELGWRFIDTDLLIPCQYSRERPAIFREYEKKVICSLTGLQRCVIATGGGAILDQENVTLLKKLGKVIYLFVPKETLKKRLLQGPLPLFLDPENQEISFEKMYEERERLYAAIADFQIPGYS
jgi:shikimate kinase